MTDLFNETLIARTMSECTLELPLTFRGLKFRVFSDDQVILTYLEGYFSGLTEDDSEPHSEQRLYLLNDQPDTSATDWTPVKRTKISPLGLKEAYLDRPDGRWIHKVRTDMVMFQSLTTPIAMGELMKNRSQVVNFINNQFLNHYQQKGYLLGHAAAFDIDGDTTAIAASSGGGKSTLMLRALESDRARFLSNDRILLRPADSDSDSDSDSEVDVIGLAKHPRVNPGTLINSERLVSILPPEERARFSGIPKNELWDIEQKYDVMIGQIFGSNKATLSGRLKHLILLDWSLDSPEPTTLVAVDLQENPEALDGLRKSPGPFYQSSDGTFPLEQSQTTEVYARNLLGVKVWRLAGRTDFDQAINQLHEKGIL